MRAFYRGAGLYLLYTVTLLMIDSYGRSQTGTNKPLSKKVQVATSEKDLLGDTLPMGALSRLGTDRLRQVIIQTVAFSPDGKQIASGGRNGITLWESASGKKIRRFLIGRTIDSISFSRNGRLLAAASSRASYIVIWDLKNQKELTKIKTLGNEWQDKVCFSPDGKYLASSGNDALVHLWDPFLGKEVRLFGKKRNDPFKCIQDIAFSRDGKILIAGNCDRGGRINLWDTTSGRKIRSLRSDCSNKIALAVSADGNLLASGGDNSSLQIWELSSGKEMCRLTAEYENIESIAFAPNKRFLCVAGLQPDKNSVYKLGFLKVWDIEEKKVFCQLLEKQLLPMRSVAFSPNGRLVASGGFGNCIRLFEIPSGKEQVPGPSHFGAVRAAASTRRTAPPPSPIPTLRAVVVPHRQGLQSLRVQRPLTMMVQRQSTISPLHTRTRTHDRPAPHGLSPRRRSVPQPTRPRGTACNSRCDNCRSRCVLASRPRSAAACQYNPGSNCWYTARSADDDNSNAAIRRRTSAEYQLSVAAKAPASDALRQPRGHAPNDASATTCSTAATRCSRRSWTSAASSGWPLCASKGW